MDPAVDTACSVRPKNVPFLYECYGCSELYATNHLCRAAKIICNVCHEIGHFSELCEKWKPAAQAETTQPSVSTDSVHGSNDVDMASVTNDERRKQKAKRKRSENINSGIEDANEERRVISNVLTDIADKKPREYLSEDQPITELKLLVDTLRKQNLTLQKAHDDLKVMNDNLQKDVKSERNLSDRYQNKLRMYRNAPLARSMDKLQHKNDQLREKLKKCEEQRTQRAIYIKRLEVHAKVLRSRVHDLTKDYYVLVDLLYLDYPVRQLPIYYKPCWNCGSKHVHHIDDCVAKGNVCGNCYKRNHFTAVCFKDDGLGFRFNKEEETILNLNKDDVATEDSLSNVMLEFETVGSS